MSLISIKEATSLSDYNDNIKKTLVSFLIKYYSEQKNKLYLFSRGNNLPNIFLLKLALPAEFNKKKYDINLLIYFPINFPSVPPEIFFHKYCSVKINPNCLNYIDEETLKINYNIFFKWENSFQSFQNLIKAISKQFEINFPIFTSKDKFDESQNNKYDCVLRKQLCKEIEFKKPIDINKNIIIYNKIIKTEGNNNINRTKINILDTSPKKTNIKKENINNSNKEINKNINIDLSDISNNKKEVYMNNKNKTEIIRKFQKSSEINNKPEQEEFDEKISKDCLLKLLISELYPKISKINYSINTSKNNLNKIKLNIISELNDFKSKEKQTQTIEKSLNLLKKEINQNNINTNNNSKNKINFSNLDNIFQINNKKNCILCSKEKVLEEYLLVIKKNLEKKNMNLTEALKLVRDISRQIFNIKFKRHCILSKNK